jgi:hypothetical protein
LNLRNRLTSQDLDDRASYVGRSKGDEGRKDYISGNPNQRLGPQAHKPLESIDGETDENGACKEYAEDSGEKKRNEKR